MWHCVMVGARCDPRAHGESQGAPPGLPAWRIQPPGHSVQMLPLRVATYPRLMVVCSRHAVGLVVGLAVGLSVGLAVGACVGFVVGKAVGAVVGERVGFCAAPSPTALISTF